MDEPLTPEQIRNLDALEQAGYYMSKAIEQFAVEASKAGWEIEQFVAAWKQVRIKYPKDFPD